MVKGVADGCVERRAVHWSAVNSGNAGVLSEDEYDVAGFSVAWWIKRRIIDGTKVKAGDTLVGIASSGVHSNGFSLVRKIFALDEAGAKKRLGPAL